MGKLIVMVGPSGSGKSTFIEDNLSDYIVYSSDEYRKMGLGDNIPTQMVNDIIDDVYNKGDLNVVLDATHMKFKRRALIYQQLKDLFDSVVIIVLVVEPSQCYNNIQQRIDKGGIYVPYDEVINQIRSFEPPIEGHDCDEIATFVDHFDINELDLKGDISLYMNKNVAMYLRMGMLD